VQLPPAATDWRERLPLLLVVAFALVMAAVQCRQFLDVHRHLWWGGTHDRNAHYLYSLRLAGDVRGGQIFHWLENVNNSRVWPPLQPLLASAALVVGGFDYRFAVWPSLVGWMGAMIFGFLVARRMVPRGGNLAGAVAVLFIALSPAHRSYATDVMLESLGAGLTLAVLYAYLVTVQQDGDGARAGRWLGIALTALFVQKYNYWLLVFLAVTASEVVARRRELWAAGRSLLPTIDWGRLIRGQLLSVWNYAILGTLLVVVAVYAYGDRPLVWRGREVGVFPPYNIMQLAYWLAFVRLVLWWRKTGRAWADGLDMRLRQVIRWHLWPAAAWLALPKHVGPFAWYLSLGNSGDGQNAPALQGLKDYAAWAAADYHVALVCALLVVGLTAVAVLAAGRLNRGSLAVLALFFIAAFLSVMHPNRKARNLHSWIPAAWVCAGAGAAVLVHNRLSAHRPRLQPWLACAVLGGLGYAHLRDGLPRAHAVEGGPRPSMPSLIDVTDSYLPDLDGSKPVTVLPAVGIWPQVQWTFFERNGGLTRLQDHRSAFGPLGEANRQGFCNWLATTSDDTIVCIEALPGPLVETGWEQIEEIRLHAELRDVLNDQQQYRLARREEFPRHGCAVTVWKREK
jgi:hypothetical protein